jgi:DNA-binding HxlR family transcriptional regulator
LDAGLSVGAAVLTEPNAIGSTLGLLGDEWTLLIVRGAFEGARRYGDWKERLPISDAVLSARLGRLVEADVLRRETAARATRRQDYVLTGTGRDLWQLLLCIWDWERLHVAGQRERLPRMGHTTCGSDFHPVLRCGSCLAPTDVHDVDAAFGPSGGFERSVPVGGTRRRPTVGRGSSVPGMFADTMAIIGSRWSSAVLGAAFLGATRFRDFEQIGAPPSIVSDRLRSFVELGVLEQTGPAAAPLSYRLSAKGAAFFPVVVSFLVWGERWRPSPDGPAVVATHRACAGPFVPELSCSACTHPLTRSTVRITPTRT